MDSTTGYSQERILAGLHPALLPFTSATDIVSGSVSPPLGVRCIQPGRVEIAGDLLGRSIGQVLLRYGLEMSWLLALPEISPEAACVLAARAAGCFALLPNVLPNEASLPPALAAMTGRTVDFASIEAILHVFADTHTGSTTLSPHDLACVEALWPLVVPTECLLASGGDDRLTLNPATGRNRYGCTPWPQIATISFGSCTASSLSPEAFTAAERSRQCLAASTLRTAPSVALAQAADDIGAALLAHFDVLDIAEAVLAASGTDAALVVTGLLAAERPNERLTSILMSPTETGSGVPHAVQGRHFASSAAAGCKVGKGQPIEGMTRGPNLVTIALRHPSGGPRNMADIAGDCETAIRAGVAAGRVVLHAIDGSKTGLTAPDRATCRRLAETYGHALDIVVDACQARVEPALARWYLEQGFPVLVTGSKFFAAPGFCGAVLFPRARLQRIARHGRLPAGLAPYARLEGGFGSRRCPGLVLRWCAALHQMQAFAKLPAQEVRQRLSSIGRSVRDTMRPYRRLHLAEAPRPAGFGWSGRRSVFTFAVQSEQRWMTAAELRPLYEAIGETTSSGGIHWQACQLGQPVELGSAGIGGLRVAISAAQVVRGGDVRDELTIVLDRLANSLDEDFTKRAADLGKAAKSLPPGQPTMLTG